VNHQNLQTKVTPPPESLDAVAEWTCRTVYQNCNQIDLRTLTDQTAKYIAKRYQVPLSDAHQACAKWMLTEATIHDAYTPEQRERLRSSHWMQRQLELHDEYLRQARQRIKARK